jgi:hypothetical protein
MIPQSATPTEVPDLYDGPIKAESVYWRDATDNGRDTAFGRKLAAEKRAARAAEAVTR